MSHITPATQRAALERIVAGIKANEVSPPKGCRYLNETGKPCIIGHLMPPEMRAEILAMPEHSDFSGPANETSIEALASVLGLERVERAIGITIPQAERLQRSWDGGCFVGNNIRKEVLDELEDILAGRLYAYRGIRFDVTLPATTAEASA